MNDFRALHEKSPERVTTGTPLSAVLFRMINLQILIAAIRRGNL
jgi:hypothetical protein